MTRQRNLGEQLGAALETGPSRRTLAAQRARLLATVTQSSRAPRLSLVFAVCAAVGLVAAVLLVRGRASLPKETLQGAWQGRSLPESSRVVAPAGRGETLSFSD